MSEQENEETKRNCLLGWVTKTTDDGWGVGPYICVCVCMDQYAIYASSDVREPA